MTTDRTARNSHPTNIRNGPDKLDRNTRTISSRIQRVGASRLLLLSGLTLLSILWLIPTYVIVVNATVSTSAYTGTASWWFHDTDFIGNITAAFEVAAVGQGMLNSLLYAVVAGGAAVLIAAAASFAVVIMSVKRPVVWFWTIYMGTILPLQIFLAPLFDAYSSLGIYDTQYGMLLIYTAITIPFAFFIIRNYMTTVASEMREAAQLDGAGWWRMFFSVHLPLARSSLIAAFIFQFTWVWNDLIFGLTLSTSDNIRPVMATLAGLNNNYSTVGPPAALAGALVASLPTIIVFFAFQRYFVTSLKLSA